ncbi:hypothetical protein Tcan_01039, partial [Toxocara canis]
METSGYIETESKSNVHSNPSYGFSITCKTQLNHRKSIDPETISTVTYNKIKPNSFQGSKKNFKPEEITFHKKEICTTVSIKNFSEKFLRPLHRQEEQSKEASKGKQQLR